MRLGRGHGLVVVVLRASCGVSTATPGAPTCPRRRPTSGPTPCRSCAVRRQPGHLLRLGAAGRLESATTDQRRLQPRRRGARSRRTRAARAGSQVDRQRPLHLGEQRGGGLRQVAVTGSADIDSADLSAIAGGPGPLRAGRGRVRRRPGLGGHPGRRHAAAARRRGGGRRSRPATPAAEPAAAPAPLPDAGSDFWRDRWGWLLAAAGLLLRRRAASSPWACVQRRRQLRGVGARAARRGREPPRVPGRRRDHRRAGAAGAGGRPARRSCSRSSSARPAAWCTSWRWSRSAAT